MDNLIVEPLRLVGLEYYYFRLFWGFWEVYPLVFWRAFIIPWGFGVGVV